MNTKNLDNLLQYENDSRITRPSQSLSKSDIDGPLLCGELKSFCLIKMMLK